MARIQELKLNRGNRGLLLLAVAAGLVAAVLVFVALANSGGDDNSVAAPGATTDTTVVAAQNIPAGTTVTAEMLKTVQVPQDLLVKGAYAETTPVVGEVTRVAIAPGEQLTPAKIGPLAEGKGLAGVVPKGKRGIAVEVRESTAVGGLLIPGDRVDVIAVFPGDHPLLALFSPFEGSIQPSVSITILQNVEVLSVAQEAQKPLGVAARDTDGDGTPDVATSGQLPENVDEQPKASTVTLAVDPQQAQLLALAQGEAKKVWLSLRAFGDEDIVTLPAVDISAVRP